MNTDDDKKEELTGQELDDFKRGLEGNDDEGLLFSRSEANLEGLKQNAIAEKQKDDAEEKKEDEEGDD